MSVVAGVDLSLTSTGIAVLTNGRCSLLESRGWGGEDGASDEDRCDRMVEMTFFVLDAIPTDADIVLIERPLYKSTTGHHFDRAGLWNGVYAHLHRVRHTPIAVVHVSTLKAWGSGVGGGGKTGVVTDTKRRWPKQKIRTDDEADALSLAEIGAFKLGDTCPGFRWGYRHHNGIRSTGISWPAAWATKAAV